jgi:hypothetical protein
MTPATTLRESLPPSTAASKTWESTARALPARFGPRPSAARVASHSRTMRASMLAIGAAAKVGKTSKSNSLR